jgi:uncharacterized membrane protein YqaE (UPF0057 family)
LKKGRETMFKDLFGIRRNRAERARQAGPECLVAREEIMISVFAESGAGAESVSAHLEKCESCRLWAAEIRRMHGLCRGVEARDDPSQLTLSALKRRPVAPSSPVPNHGERGPAAERSSDRGAFFVVALVAILFNVILAIRLEGNARVLYPVIGFVVMIASAAWVHIDSSRRGMQTAFWTALQPFTFPAGLVAYLACRRHACVRCPGCGKTARASDRFCTECGGGLAAFCCGCGRAVRKEFRVCPFCGTRLEECFPREDGAGRTCGWSRAQIAFVVGANLVIFAGFVAALLRSGTQTSFIAAFLCLLGYFPVFNWVAVDSRRRAMPTIFWGALALAALYAGLVIYLACRKDERVVCPVCGSYPPSSFNFCPCCGSLLGARCRSCGAASRGGRFCAFCGSETIIAAVSPQSPG